MPLTVNGKPVDEGLLDAEFGQIKAHFEQQANVSCCERDDEFMGYAKENIIAKVLLAQDAEETMPEPAAADIDAKLADLVKEYGGEESLYYSLGIAPGQEDGLRRDIAASMRVDQLVEQVGGEAAACSDEEVESYYKSHADDFMSAEEVRSMHIFKSLRQAEDREAVFHELREVRTKALAGADFMELVREHSDKPEEEADLGWYKRGEIMDEYELITFSMEIDEISPVFATQWGMHLAKLCERKTPQLIPLTEVTDNIRERIAAEQKDAKLQRYVETLKEKAEIVDTTDSDQ
jgi:hypothetical protein